ncbi:phosphatase [Lithospermum erythrorhizon]|uniref:Phosphatase n=1 Tax=Lithospermum erythrorhizon TaxID=34254 RepID=A0AAV3QX05_LITER
MHRATVLVGQSGIEAFILGTRSEIFDEHSFNDWVQLAEAPAIPASLRLYQGLQELGFTIVLLTGRDEFQRNCTEKNLQYAGFSSWERLFLRGDTDKGKLATIYKSEKRMELTDQGFRIHGNSGDQWSDLIGFAVAKRSFKLPNPLYYIS